MGTAQGFHGYPPDQGYAFLRQATLTLRTTSSVVLAIAGNALKAFPGLGTLGASDFAQISARAFDPAWVAGLR